MNWVRGFVLAGCLLLATPASTQQGDDELSWVDNVAEMLHRMNLAGGIAGIPSR